MTPSPKLKLKLILIKLNSMILGKITVSIIEHTIFFQPSSSLSHIVWHALANQNVAVFGFGTFFVSEPRLPWLAGWLAGYKSFSAWSMPGRGGGGYSPKFRIGVCRERSQTLTLSKDKENEN